MSLNKLTVIIRDSSPAIHLGEPCKLRTVVILLTAEQQEQIKLKHIGTRNIGTANEIKDYEEVSQCILEEEKEWT